MKEILKIDIPNFKADYEVEWFESVDFSNLKNVKQVYGVLFNEKKEILIVNTVGNWQLPGGKPEKGEGWEEALIREVNEEAGAEIDEIVPLGYQIVSELRNSQTGPPFCQLRFAAKIRKLNKPAIDPSSGKIPDRKFIAPEDFLRYCPWGKIGQHVIDKAVRTFAKP